MVSETADGDHSMHCYTDTAPCAIFHRVGVTVAIN